VGLAFALVLVLPAGLLLLLLLFPPRLEFAVAEGLAVCLESAFAPPLFGEDDANLVG